jgi:hypothetical protein
MPKVFVSYAHEDTDSAMRLYEELCATKGVDPWLDKRKLMPGIRWKPAIRKAIREADFFIALLSKRSTAKKGFVHREMSEALEILKEFPDDQIFLIPIRLDDCKIPYEALADIQYVDFFPNWKTGLDLVLSAISSSLPQPVGQQQDEILETLSTYHYRVGIVDLDNGLTNVTQIAQRLNTIQVFFHFTSPSLPSTKDSIREIGGSPNLFVSSIPDSFYTEHQYLSVDLVACLTRYPLAFKEDDKIRYNHFSGPGDTDERFMFVSLSQLYDFTKRANRTLEKGIVYIIISQLIVHFTNRGYHADTRGCVMDYCGNRSDMIEGLMSLRLCEGCSSQLTDSGLLKAVYEMLADEMRL